MMPIFNPILVGGGKSVIPLVDAGSTANGLANGTYTLDGNGTEISLSRDSTSYQYYSGSIYVADTVRYLLIMFYKNAGTLSGYGFSKSGTYTISYNTLLSLTRYRPQF